MAVLQLELSTILYLIEYFHSYLAPLRERITNMKCYVLYPVSVTFSSINYEYVVPLFKPIKTTENGSMSVLLTTFNFLHFEKLNSNIISME